MKLAWDVRGQGQRTLVLLHGFTGSREAWGRAEQLVSPFFRLVRVELPGHGASPLPLAAGSDGFAETIAALVAVLAEVSESPVELLGYSQGARLALGVALAVPERIRRLVMESGSPGLPHPKDRHARRDDDERLAEEILHDGIAAFVARWERLPLFAGLARLPEGEQEAMRARRLSSTSAGLAGALRCLGLGVQPDYSSRLPSFQRPTLLLAGAEDAKFAAIARRMATDLPMARCYVFTGCGHAPHLEAPAEWAREVLSFLQANGKTETWSAA